MALLWIGVAVGVLIILILIAKLLKTPATDAVKVQQRCKICGSKLEGIRCPRCEKRGQYGV